MHLDELHASLQPLTLERAESRFIALHQMAELLFRREIAELESAIASLSGNNPDLRAALECLRRSRGLTEQLLSVLALLSEQIGPAEFAAFRSALGDASGFQSIQFWEIEILSGFPETAVGRLGALAGHGEDYLALEKRLTSPNLWSVFLDLVGCRADDAESLLIVLADGGSIAELANLLRMHDLDWVRWRALHAIMVESMIGTVASGTGGTSGSNYLWSRVRMRFYPGLHEAASLIHRKAGTA